MITKVSTYYERRKSVIQIGFNDRRVTERRVDLTLISPERRRLSSQVRRYEREHIKIPVRVQANGVEISGYTENISLEGILIYSNTVLEAGTAIRLQFSFGESVCYTNIIGQVVSCRFIENGEIAYYAIGIKFNAIRDLESKILNSVIHILKQNISSQEKSLLTIIVTNDSLSQETTAIQRETLDSFGKGSNTSQQLELTTIKNSSSNKAISNGRSEYTSNTARPILEVFLSYPKGEKIVKEVLDITESGLSFKMASEEGFLNVGMPLDSILLRSRKKTYKTSGEVIDVTPFEEGGNQFFRIGVRLKGDQKGTLGFKRTSLFPFVRLPRYSSDQITNLTKFINFNTETTEEHTGALIDFSIFGTKFSLTEKITPPLHIGQKLHDFAFIIGNEILPIGNAIIAHISENGNKLIIGVSFESDTLDPTKIFLLDKKTRIKHEITKKTSFPASVEINPAFKSAIVDLRCFLEKLKKEFDKYDLETQNEEAEYKDNIERVILDSAVKHYYPIIDTSMSHIASIVENFDQHSDLIHKEFFRQHLHALFLEAPFINRAYRKPLGYAGDYEMMNMLYRDSYEGETLFGKFLNNHIYQSPAAKAVRNRVPFLTDKIEMVVRNSLPLKSNTNYISVASIGCGPAKEIQDFLSRSDKRDQCKFSLIDSDKSALQHCQEKILRIDLSRKVRTKARFIHKSVIEIARGKEDIFPERQDLIYSIGLFDYLNTDFSKQLIRVLFENLNSNGVLIVGDFDPSCPTKNYLEYTMEWHLIYRNNSQMLELADLLNNIKEANVEKEPERVNNFLVLKKDG
ncbi:MAG: PilZ domain-containing protein [Candidatus Manganitrophus sp. SB1]|nr:PilZ domain-containing protein [Candidatus Manganitrophus morganii]